MARSTRNNPARTQLGMEFLEGRVVPAVFVTQLDLDNDGTADDIRILGDAGSNKVSIQDNGAGALKVSVDANGDGDTTDAGDSTDVAYNFSGNTGVVDVVLFQGDDTVTYTLTGNLTAGTRALSVNLGKGDDSFTMTTGTFDITGKSHVAVDVEGRLGADVMDVSLDTVSNSVVSVRAEMGLGDDKGSVKIFEIDDTAAADIDAYLADGLNSFAVDLRDVGKNGQADVNVNVVGGNQADVVALNLRDDVGNGSLRSSLVFNADLLDGNDTFTASLDYNTDTFRVDDFSVATIAVHGGVGDDSLSVQGVGATGTIRLDANAMFGIDLRGGFGNDAISVNLSKTDALEILGGIRVRMHGGAGDDKLTTLLANEVDTTGAYDVAVYGGGGDDTATFALTNNGGAPKFNPLGKVILDGGVGADSITNTNKPVSLTTGFETVV